MLLQETWANLQYKLSPKIVEALKAYNFVKMMPVQKAVIPLMMKNYDLAVEAQTGSGKSLSFVVPIIEKLLKMSINSQKTYTPLFLILSPTRQLCHQTYDLLVNLVTIVDSNLLKYFACTTGGKPLGEDLKRCDDNILIIGTVGRLKEILSSKGKSWFSKLDYLYIDEGDRLLKQKGIQQLINALPKMRRTAIFSATLQDITESDLKLYGMRNLAKISLRAVDIVSHKNKPKKQDDYNVPKSLRNEYQFVDSREQKIYYLINFLINHAESKTIVFFNTCASVEFYTKILSTLNALNKLNVQGIHGQLKHKKRNKIITAFMENPAGVLLATDVVARGIDFENVNYILQIDPPDDPDNFVHRIGRTARINRVGNALLFLQKHESTFIEYLKNKGVEMHIHKPIKRHVDQNKLKQDIFKLLLSDRDLIEKSKKAFVSFVRSYKEHQLKYIFEFKNLPIGPIANSFFLLRLPRIKEILGKHIDGFTQSEIDVESIPWKAKNQRLQFEQKKQNTKDKKQSLQKHTVTKDIKNIKSQRKKIKSKMTERQNQNLRRQEKLIRKEKFIGGKRSHKQTNIVQEDYSEDTEQIEQRITKKLKK